MYVYVPHDESKPYFDMAHEWVLADRMFQSQLDESFVAHQYVIAAQAAVERRSAASACGAAPEVTDFVRHDHAGSKTGRPSTPCFDYQTLGDELDNAGLTWRFYASVGSRSGEGSRGRPIRPSSTSVTGPTGRERHLAELEVHHRRPARRSSRTSPGSRRSVPTPTTRSAAAATGHRGLRRSSTRSVRASSGTRPRSSCSGTIGAASTITFRHHYDGLRQLGLPRSAAGHLTVRKAELRLARAVRNGKRAAICRRSVRARSARGRRQRGRSSPAKDCFDFPQKPRPFVKIEAPKPPDSSCGRYPTTSCCRTTSSRMTRKRPIPACVRSGSAIAGRLFADTSPTSAVALPYMRGGAALRALDETGAGKITHVVYIVQENRSFDDIFQGYPGADTVSSGKNSKGQTIALQPMSLTKSYDIDHSAEAMFAACNGTGKLPGTDCRMDGFNKEQSVLRAEKFASTSTCRTRVEAILRHGARVGGGRPNVPIAARRELRRASIYHRRPSGVER